MYKYFLLVLLLSGCSSTVKPIFKVGECIQSTYFREVWESKPYIERNEVIGQQSYKTLYWSQYINGWHEWDGVLRFWSQEHYQIVPCPNITGSK